MKSLQFRFVELILKYFSHRNIFKLQGRELRDYLEKTKGNRKISPPEFIIRKFKIRNELIQGRPCYIINPREESGSPKPGGGSSAVFFIHGGGYIFEANRIHWQAVSRLVSKLGIPVYFPVYPLLPDNTLEEALVMITESFNLMKMEFSPDTIAALGDSAGANLALALCHQNKSQGLSMPAKLILISPAMAGEDDPDILEAMNRQANCDVMFDMQYFHSLGEIMDIQKKNSLTVPMMGDFSDFPDMHIFSGTCETFYPQVRAFAERLKTQGVRANFCFGEGMMHVWPYMPAARECREALNAILRIIDSE